MIKFGNKDKKKTKEDDSAEAEQEGTAVDLLNSLQGGPEQRSIMSVSYTHLTLPTKRIV